MTSPQLQYPGASIPLTALSLRAELDNGWSGEAILAERWPGISRGVRGKIILGGRSFDIAVRQFHQPWRGQQSPWIAFCDPVSFEPEFHQSVFASAEQAASFGEVVCVRFPIDAPHEFFERRFSHVILDGLSLVEALRAMTGRLNPDWHWSWRNEKIEIGPLPNGGVAELETSREANVEDGWEADVHLGLPGLGDRVKTVGPDGSDREGNVVQIRADFPDRPLAIRIRVAERIPPRPPPRLSRTVRCNATVTHLEPFMVQVHLPAASPMVRGSPYALHTGTSTLGIPLKVGHRLLVDWAAEGLLARVDSKRLLKGGRDSFFAFLALASRASRLWRVSHT